MRFWLAALVILVMGAFPASAKTRGLLFGVSEYPGLPPGKSLSAPGNDVRRFRQALAARGIGGADVVVLADGVEEAAGLPTRAAILDGLKRLETEAERGDLIIIYGSGHGSRQKSIHQRKLDGLDQVFLPRDVAPDNGGGASAFRHAIVSVEFGAHLDAIRRRGADVWFILDSCFSGSASRAVGEGVHDKMVDPGDIGLAVANAFQPDQALPLAESLDLPPGSGRLAAFYASQPNETAREVALPLNLPLEKRSWGSIFTLALTKAMARSPGLSYRQTMVETGRLLRADAAFQARQTPSYEGDGLDAPMPGAASLAPASAWRVDGGILLAGQLEGIEEGAILALFDNVDSLATRPVGAAVVTRVEPLQAVLAALRPGCDPLKIACAQDATGAALRRASYARLIKPAAGAALTLSAPRVRPGAPPPGEDQQARFEAALAAALAGPLKGRVLYDDAAPEVVAWLDADGLRLMPNGMDPVQSEVGPVVAATLSGGDLELALARALLRARQILGLQRIEAAAMGGARGLDVSIETRRAASTEVNRQCVYTPGQSGQVLAEGEAIKSCDRIVVTLENRSKGAILPSVFFLDDRWNLIARRPSCPVGLTVADRLEPGRRLIFEVPYHPRAFRPGRAPATANGALVLGVPFREGETALPNLCGLQAFNDQAGQATRSIGEEDDLDQLIAGATRGGSPLALDAASMALSFWPVSQPVQR